MKKPSVMHNAINVEILLISWKQSKTLVLAIKRAAKHYGDITDLERDLRIMSENVFD